jgi:hypothetical protein
VYTEEVKVMTPLRTSLVCVLSLIVLGLAGFLAGQASPSQNTSFEAATVILIVTAGAVGIERFLEIGWTTIALTAGAAWPMNLLKKQVDLITDQLDASLKPYQEQAESMLAQLSVQQQWTKQQMQIASEELAKLKTAMTDLKQTAKDKEQLQIFASAAAQYINYIQAKYTTVYSLATGGSTTEDRQAAQAAQEAQSKAKQAIYEKEQSDAREQFNDIVDLEEREQKLRVFLESKEVRDRINLAGERAFAGSLADSRLQQAITLVSNTARFKALGKAKKDTEVEQAGAQAQAALEEQVRIARTQAQQQAQARGASDEEAERASAQAALAVISDVLSADPARTIGTAVNLAQQGIQGVTDFVASFKDNPGRRLVSLYVAAFIGVIVAGFLRLDVFQAVLSAPPDGVADTTAATAFQWGIVLTGLLMGLGSNPTHEVIRVLQEYKKSRGLLNVPTTTAVDVPISQDSFPVMASLPAVLGDPVPGGFVQAWQEYKKSQGVLNAPKGAYDYVLTSEDSLSIAETPPSASNYPVPGALRFNVVPTTVRFIRLR